MGDRVLTDRTTAAAVHYSDQALGQVDPAQPVKADKPDVVPVTRTSELKAQVREFAQHCAQFRGASIPRATIQILTTTAPFVVLLVGMILLADLAYWATLLLAIPAGLLLIRYFIIQHDCGHGSYLPSKRANDLLGRFMSLLTLTPYGLWRREHAMHHASSGNLERRGVGDIETWTVEEYLKASRFARLRYRVYRHPLFLFGFGVPFYFLIMQRLPWFHALPARDSWKSVMSLNVFALMFYGAFAWFLGPVLVLKILTPIVFVAAAVGGWLFFIQHQFEETHWDNPPEWDFQTTAVHGSSYYVLPKVLQWFTGNIGLHHIHHLNSMIPNYRLQECMDALPDLSKINRLTLMESFRCVSLTLWDPVERRLVGFGELQRVRAAA
jgi:acyl-lipid omega-6 desaturase (Delta-12 desaturase)